MTRRQFLLALAVVATVVVAPERATRAQNPPAYKVIVNAKNPNTSLSKAAVGKIFLKKTTAWSGGGKIAPADQTVSAAVRESFSRAIHGKSARAVKNWWNQQIYNGSAVPPPELGGDAKVIAFVQGNESAIGYVAADAALPEGVVAVTVTQ